MTLGPQHGPCSSKVCLTLVELRDQDLMLFIRKLEDSNAFERFKAPQAIQDLRYVVLLVGLHRSVSQAKRLRQAFTRRLSLSLHLFSRHLLGSFSPSLLVIS